MRPRGPRRDSFPSTTPVVSDTPDEWLASAACQRQMRAEPTNQRQDAPCHPHGGGEAKWEVSKLDPSILTPSCACRGVLVLRPVQGSRPATFWSEVRLPGPPQVQGDVFVVGSVQLGFVLLFVLDCFLDPAVTYREEGRDECPVMFQTCQRSSHKAIIIHGLEGGPGGCSELQLYRNIKH
ncbi:hypothetical protein D4764_01G0020300 [Takifugu flavidus]|uniref:Uncharacterized protein n=1 Tax=Takifugu flavidus TaxID=433684 RepID=A0A5C6PRT6_9TELE|nr:hypothetical protein D4764_01G0020300 [Takifugu flavidus]